jgi:hypothetical protein
LRAGLVEVARAAVLEFAVVELKKSVDDAATGRAGPARHVCGFLLAAFLLALSLPIAAQQTHRPMDVPDATRTEQPEPRTRLILKDGSYQVVLGYQVVGNLVRFRSAERDGETEDIPLKLVDLPATERWKREHGPDAQDQRSAVLSPELAKEEAQREALTPEIAPNLRLPDDDSVLALDTFRATPELVPVPQEGSDLNKETAHAVQKSAINPASSAHRILDIPGYGSYIQLHVADPVFYVRVGADDASETSGGAAITVDTHGASGRATPSGGAANSDYVIERLDVRQDIRVVDSFRIGLLGSGRKQPDMIELKEDPLPGGRWLKLTPVVPLDFGEYALIEVLSDHEVNLDVWDFGVHSDAQENVEAIAPEVKRPATLVRRPKD